MLNRRCRLIAFLAVAAAISSSARAQTPLGTAFTYQGQLRNNGEPVDGPIHFRFTLWNNAVLALPANQVGLPVIVSPVNVTDGLFTVSLDFGASVFNGDARWLEIEVCADATCDSSTLLTPRQKLTPSPHALALPAFTPSKPQRVPT